ncbi:MAG: Gfo/Idh/MocA family oxidoreductase, partial [Candidatus Aminicenantes bacterium]|nr:Gfo/Idh/MocA family oxidoreductase [Candidatus Aminicenantes bacterium]
MDQENDGRGIKEISQPNKEVNTGRRDVLKALASIPVLGAFFYGLAKKKTWDAERRKSLLEELGLEGELDIGRVRASLKKPGELLRIGIIGYGGRGEHLVRAAGFAHQDFFEIRGSKSQRTWRQREIQGFLDQEDLNVLLTGVCDVFDVRAERSLAASLNDRRPGGGAGNLKGAKRFRSYQDMLGSKDIDAVIIATPDHWHAQMAIDAVKAGKHVYLEKCMTRTEEEVYALTDAVKKSGMVFQLGHQNPQQETFWRAKQIVDKNILGKITLVETTTNRNSPNGAWVYSIHKDANPQTIDWEQFQGPAPHRVPFSLERFFRWRCWYDYGTGLSGDLFSHEFDAVNQILGMGIPKTVVSSGGVYFFKDGRDVPDLFQAVCEYPDRDLTLVYSATLANSRGRGRVFMGHDASMEVGSGLTVNADYDSTRFEEKIKAGVIDTSLPLFSYRPGSKSIDAITSATEKYFATKGLMYTYQRGRQVDLTHLHVKEWIDCIRTGEKPS